jgi:protein-tyrosine phosphatase
VFVHCKRGADRTGAVVGLYRVLRQDWSVDRAYDEARAIGMRWWYSGVKKQLEGLASALSTPLAE